MRKGADYGHMTNLMAENCFQISYKVKETRKEGRKDYLECE